MTHSTTLATTITIPKGCFLKHSVLCEKIDSTSSINSNLDTKKPTFVLKFSKELSAEQKDLFSSKNCVAGDSDTPSSLLSIYKANKATPLCIDFEIEKISGENTSYRLTPVVSSGATDDSPFLLKNYDTKYFLKFEAHNLLPDEVLWRYKEAFSDGVTS